MGSGQLDERIERIAADRESGASELIGAVIEVLAAGIEQQADIRALGRALIRAQPSMAPVWNAVRAAIRCGSDSTAFERYIQQGHRESRAISRHAAAVLLPDHASERLRIVTISFSGTVLEVMCSLTARHTLEVACAEGQPALEGRRMAQRLSEAGVPVTYYTDAAIGHALTATDAVLLGADAVTPDWFLNKSGSRMLAAAAVQRGVPVYVAAGRSKFLSAEIGARLEIRHGEPAEVWPAPPAGVTVRNPYFEATPLDLVAAVISDIGILGAALVPDACPTADDEVLVSLVKQPA